jgi:anaerobic selenocysteine-containing dehydrogenase
MKCAGAVGARAPGRDPDDEYPLILTTGRVKYHWHTMTRTGKNQALRRSAPDPILELSRADARRFNILDGDFEQAGSPLFFKGNGMSARSRSL